MAMGGRGMAHVVEGHRLRGVVRAIVSSRFVSRHAPDSTRGLRQFTVQTSRGTVTLQPLDLRLRGTFGMCSVFERASRTAAVSGADYDRSDRSAALITAGRGTEVGADRVEIGNSAAAASA